MENLTIDFYDEANASVSVSWSPGTEQFENYEARLFANLLLFACFTLRQLRYLGRHPSVKAISERLLEWVPSKTFPTIETDPIRVLLSHVLLDAAVDLGMDWDRALDKYGSPIYLVPFNGNGTKRFLGWLGIAQERPVFIMSSRGFGLGGLIGWNIPQFAADSVFILLEKFNLMYKSDQAVLDSLAQVAHDCGKVALGKDIAMLHQELLAFSFVNRHIPHNR